MDIEYGNATRMEKKLWGTDKKRMRIGIRGDGFVKKRDKGHIHG